MVFTNQDIIACDTRTSRMTFVNEILWQLKGHMLVSPSIVEYTNMVIYIERKFVENIMNGAILSE